MRSKNELYQEAMRTVSARRQAARTRAEDTRRQLQAAIPALAFAEEEVRVRGIKAALAGANGGDRAQALAGLHAANQKLTALLAEYGRTPQQLQPQFTCPLCQDTGIQGGKACACVRKLMRQMRREEIESLSSLKIRSFASMRAEYYPERLDPETHKNIRPYMAALLRTLQEYAQTFDRQSENLLLYGNAGLGKTHAALAIAGAVLEKGYDVIYVSSPDFFGRVESLRFGADAGGEREALMETVCSADLLILDDLGTEFNSNYLISTLYTVLNNRLGARLPTIITTNVVQSELLEKLYTEKIASRISSFVAFHFIGQDIRGLKNQM